MQPRRPGPPESLASRLRRETAVLHEAAERSPLIAALIAGTIGREPYVALLTNLLHLYRALESALHRHRDDARLAFALAPRLARAARLEQDLARLAAGLPAVPPARAALSYGEHLGALAARDPLRLVSHAYVRYLGDLYGGQQLARRVRERFQLAGDEGTRFYDFGPAASLPAQRAAFRAGLDALVLDATQADEIVAEACSAFERHLDLFAEIVASR